MKKFIALLSLILSNQGAWAQDWNLVEDLVPSDALESDFGTNMVFADDKLVVSWPRIFTRGVDADNCGEVITYQKVGGQYQEMARLTAQDLVGVCTNGDGFGFGLAFDNGRLAIGMPAGVRSGMGNSGGMSDADSRVFITTFENSNWALQETLTGSDIGNGKGMGFQLVMEAGVLLVHAHEYDTIFGFSFPVSTGVYVFEDSGSGFNETQKLEEDFHLFGQDFDYENNQIIVGAWGEQALTEPGRIYVYENNSGSWTNTQTINDTRNSNLGNQIEIVDNTMVAGSVQAGGVGGVTVFSKDSSGKWSEKQFIQASDNTFNDQFGISLKFDTNDLIVGAGAGQDASLTLGAVYTYKLDNNGNFVEDQKLVASNPTDRYDRFGGNLIFNESDLLVTSVSGGFENADVTSFHHFSRESTGGNAPTEYAVNSKVSGTWNSADASTQKISIEILNDGRAIMFASLNNNGENLWLLGIGDIADNVIDFSEIYSATGAKFGNAFNANDVIKKNEGQAMVSFSLCNQATLSYDLSDIETNEVVIIKDLEIPGNECTNNNKALPNGISGTWYDPARSGEGITVYLFDQGNTQMATITWYTYDANGNQLWVSGTGTVTDQTINIADMKQYTGANLFSGSTQSSSMGSLSLTWNECKKAIVDYDFSSGGLGNGQLNLTQLTVLDNTQCDIQK